MDSDSALGAGGYDLNRGMSAPPKLGHCSDVTGPLSQWLYSVLVEVGLPAICVETRHMRAMSPSRRKLVEHDFGLL